MSIVGERYIEGCNAPSKALNLTFTFIPDNQPVRPGDVFKKVKTMDVPTGIGLEHFYRWLRKYLDRHTEIKDMVFKVLVGPKSAVAKANQD